MTRYCIDSNEDWPVYGPRPVRDDAPEYIGVEIPSEFIERFSKAADEWKAVQDKLGEYEEEAERRYDAYVKEHGCKKMRHGFNDWSLRQCNQLPNSRGVCPLEGQHVSD